MWKMLFENVCVRIRLFQLPVGINIDSKVYIIYGIKLWE